MKSHGKVALLIITFWLPVSVAAQGDSSQTKHAVMAVLDTFMASFNDSNPEAHTATYHFPHFRLAQGNMAIWQTRDDAINAHNFLFKNLPRTGWHRSEWIERNILSISDSKAHVATRFRRLHEDGSEIVVTQSLYVLTKENGRWGIKLRSSYL